MNDELIKSEPEPEPTSLTKFFTEGTILAAVPGIGYLTTFLCEAEFANYFHIPISLISLDTASVVQNTFGAGVILFWGWNYAAKIGFRMLGDKDGASPPVWVALLFLLWPVTMVWKIWWPFVVLGGIAILETFLIWLQKRRHGNTNIFIPLDPRGVMIMMLIHMLIWFYVVARGVGHLATREEEFYVSPAKQESPELVVLRFYGDKAILAPFDRKRKLVKAALKIVPLGLLGETMRRERIGPLTSE